MTTALIYLVVMVLTAGVVFLLVSAVFGRGEELAPLPPGASPTRLPASDITSEDVRALKFQLVLRGYRMSEVDWVLNRLAGEVDELRARIAELERALDERPGARHPVATAAAEHNHGPEHNHAPEHGSNNRLPNHRPQPSQAEKAP